IHNLQGVSRELYMLDLLIFGLLLAIHDEQLGLSAATQRRVVFTVGTEENLIKSSRCTDLSSWNALSVDGQESHWGGPRSTGHDGDGHVSGRSDVELKAKGS